jgi:hypothetical protein
MGILGRMRDRLGPGKPKDDADPEPGPERSEAALEPPDPLAAARAGPSGPGALPPGALADADLTIEPSLLQDQPPVAPPQEAVAETDQEVNDRLARLARDRKRGSRDV